MKGTVIQSHKAIKLGYIKIQLGSYIYIYMDTEARFFWVSFLPAYYIYFPELNDTVDFLTFREVSKAFFFFHKIFQHQLGRHANLNEPLGTSMDLIFFIPVYCFGN
uniref:Uncharacterized protein n=1 Tax=Neolamprologus brichardi TaxID=32507 RepID=A0A3Q4HAU7_NEOBR